MLILNHSSKTSAQYHSESFLLRHIPRWKTTPGTLVNKNWVYILASNLLICNSRTWCETCCCNFGYGLKCFCWVWALKVKWFVWKHKLWLLNSYLARFTFFKNRWVAYVLTHHCPEWNHSLHLFLNIHANLFIHLCMLRQLTLLLEVACTLVGDMLLCFSQACS